MTIPTGYEHLVLDSGPLLAAHLPASLSNVFYTVPEVLAEIRDPASKARLAALPFHIECREPSGVAYKRAWEFAKGTGDLASLSKTDLKVIALVIELEMRFAGRTFEDVQPLAINVHQGRPKQMAITKEEPAGLPEASDEEGEWITPENVAERKQRDLLRISAQPEAGQPPSRIACMTTDFAMQNALLQMRCNVCSPTGQRISQLKSWMLRCHACYWHTADMSRRFCDRCGGPTLMRTSYALDAAGKPHFFLQKNFRYNLRGTRYTAALPEGGRTPDPLICREDQKEYLRAVRAQRRSEAKEVRRMANGIDLADVDDRLAGVFGGMQIASDAMAKMKNKMQNAPAVAIGAGRRNLNEVRRRKH